MKDLSTPLHEAAINGHDTIVAALIEGKANVDSQNKVILIRGREGFIRRCRGGIGRGQRGCQGEKEDNGVQ